jgi:hypothetical protein
MRSQLNRVIYLNRKKTEWLNHPKAIIQTNLLKPSLDSMKFNQ